MRAHHDPLAYANALFREGRHAEAEVEFRAHLERDPKSGGAMFGLAVILMSRKDSAAAVELLRKAVKAAPQNARIRGLLGQAYESVGKHEESARAYEEAARLDPTDPKPLVNGAAALMHLNRNAEAIAVLKRALTIAPGDPLALKDLVVATARVGTPEEAMSAAVAYGNLPPMPPTITRESQIRAVGTALVQAGRVAEGIAMLERAAANAPGDADLRHVLGLAYLISGQHRRGFELWQARGQAAGSEGMAIPKKVAPAWDGVADVRGKRVLVLAEQGVGDALQFARYLPELARRGAEVIVGCNLLAVTLLERVEGVRSASPDDPPPAHDLSVLMLDLPLLLGVPDEIARFASPYLTSEPERVARIRGHLGKADGRPRVALCWSGSPLQPVNARRAFDPRRLEPLIKAFPGVQFVSAQKLPLPGTSTPKGLLDPTPHLRDFADTAALIDAVDLLITTDTSTAHLAGGMGKASWVLLHHPTPHWPFAQSGDRCEWYPGLRLFRQPAYGDWDSVIAGVRAALGVWLSERVSSG